MNIYIYIYQHSFTKGVITFVNCVAPAVFYIFSQRLITAHSKNLRCRNRTSVTIVSFTTTIIVTYVVIKASTLSYQ
jgi:hypothetical protein